jgi:hypothetical protein
VTLLLAPGAHAADGDRETLERYAHDTWASFVAMTDPESGGPGADRLAGDHGDDVLGGGLGPDRLNGGPGADHEEEGADAPPADGRLGPPPPQLGTVTGRAMVSRRANITPAPTAATATPNRTPALHE